MSQSQVIEMEEFYAKRTTVRIEETAMKEATKTNDWLIKITDESEACVKASRSRTKPRIQRVPDLLRKNKDCPELFEPEVVAIGPYHAAKPHLRPMEEHKKAAAKQLAEDATQDIVSFYDKVSSVADMAKEWYAELPDMTDKEFVDMMFFDACFLLHFIRLSVDNRTEHLTMPPHLRGFVMKDMFLLENQLPLAVLNALMALAPVDLDKFIHRIIIGQDPTPKQTTRGSVPEEPAHLLDLLRKEILGEGELPCPSAPRWDTFRSVMELKEVGIEFAESKSKQLRNIQFKPGCVHGTLSLPPILVDDLTRSRFLNLIALEMCPDSKSDYGITSYVWFMDRLIDLPGDVKELRSKRILLNALGSDEQVANLFNELAKDLAPDYQAYDSVIQGIDRHCKSRISVSIVRMLHTHFDTPWAVIGFCAAVFLLVLSVLQTYFTIWSPGDNK